MKSKLRLASLLLILTSLARATPPALTTVTATLTDSAGQVWANAQWQANFMQPFGNPASPLNNGNPITSNHFGTADATGTFTVILDDNTVVTPSGNTWQFILCPNASVQNCSVAIVSVHGASQNLSASLSSFLSVPAVNTAPTIARAYRDSEANGGFGALYINSIDGTMRQCLIAICNGTGWQIVIIGTVNPVFTGTLTVPCVKFNFDISDDTTVCSQAATGHINVTLPAVSGTLALLASPAFSGTPTTPTQSLADNSTQIVNSAWVKGQGYVTSGGAPVTSVFGRTGAILANTGDYVVAQVSGAAPLASPVFTGTPTAPTNGSPADNTIQLATDAFVQSAISASSTKAILAQSTTTTLTTTAIGNSNNTVITKAVTMPSSGCPCRAIVHWWLYVSSTASGQDVAYVTDGTAGFAGSETATPGSASGFGFTGSGGSTITYANNAGVTFNLIMASSHAGGSTVSTSQLGTSITGAPASALNILIVSSN